MVVEWVVMGMGWRGGGVDDGEGHLPHHSSISRLCNLGRVMLVPNFRFVLVEASRAAFCLLVFSSLV